MTHCTVIATLVRVFSLFCAVVAFLPVAPGRLVAQGDANVVVDQALFSGMQWRMVGPYRGGRSTAVTGIASQPNTFFMGTTGGGVWKTTDAGTTWTNISDDHFGGSIGAIDVADSDPNVVYVGQGSLDIRGNTSMGRGMWRSTDGGKTWTFIGLREAGQIGRIEVHPTNPDIVLVAALGRPFGHNPERGVYRSRDGGDTWELVFFVNDSTGASDVALNPRNPREVYAGFWRGERKPWTLLSGAGEGGVYKSTDGGDTWRKLGGGLPEGVVGKVGVTVSPADPERVWVIIEAEPGGGVYRSDDAGKTWQRTNEENKLRQRAWYYTHIFADPQDPNTVYGLNTRLYRSVDAGRTFDPIAVPHGDTHDLWINPSNPNYMIVGDDGGAQVTVNGGASWTTYMNQPTAELYDVIVDNDFPYRLYGAQQDNTTITVPAWTSSNTLHAKEHWFSVGGCETGPVALHPDRPEIVYAGCYGGVIDRFDRTKDQIRTVNLYPQMQLGEAAKNLRYRFQWVSPMAVSPHDPDMVYHGSQYVHRTTNGGMSWETISPDLTTNTKEHLEYSGGPLNHDITGVEIYNVVFSIAPSPHTDGVIWAGTDDGRVHVTRDNGVTWTDVTPPGMPQFGTVDEIDVSPHQPGRALVAVQRYRLDDFAPYIFRTDDYGQSWSLLTNGQNGIPGDYPVRTVREDPERAGLLYAGTEWGVYVSFNDGQNWQPLQLNLPITPVTGMRVAHGDLVISTQGRSFWILDDVSPLRQAGDGLSRAAAHLYRPRDGYRVNVGGGGGIGGLNNPEPLPGNVLVNYYLAEAPEDVVILRIADAAGRTVQVFTSDSAAAEQHGVTRIEPEMGMNRLAWDGMYPGLNPTDSTILWGYSGGVRAPPGMYRVTLEAAGLSIIESFRLLKDPRLTDVTDANFDEQFRLAVAVRDTINEVYDAIRTAVVVRDGVEAAADRAVAMEVGAQVTPLADSIVGDITTVHHSLVQHRNQSGQDPIRFPPMLDSQFVALYEYVTGVDNYRFGGAEGRTTEGAHELFADLTGKWIDVSARFRAILRNDVARFNRLLQQLGVPSVVIPGPSTELIP